MSHLQTATTANTLKEILFEKMNMNMYPCIHVSMYRVQKGPSKTASTQRGRLWPKTRLEMYTMHVPDGAVLH